MKTTKTGATADGRSELTTVLAAFRGAFAGQAVFSAVINVLMLTGSLFMLEVYDRVLPSRSVPTLVGLAMLALMLYAFQAGLEIVRARVFLRIGDGVERRLAPRAFELAVHLPLRGGTDATAPVRDLDVLRSFLAGQGPAAFFDLPWLPFYLAICFAFHPMIGLTALLGMIVLGLFTVATEQMSRKAVLAAAETGNQRMRLLEACRRGSEAIVAMGMVGRLSARWLEHDCAHGEAQAKAGDTTASFAALGKVFRMTLQSAMLAVGAWLVIHQEASAGIIIASSILSGRALAPLDATIGNWKGFMAARQAWSRLEKLFGALPARGEVFALPAPEKTLQVESVTTVPPGAKRATLTDIRFTAQAGDCVCVIGHSAAGKSTLVRTLVGLWRPQRGAVRLDGATIDQWDGEVLGRHIGHLPQEVELLDGTVAENISRFDPVTDPGKVVAAARAAGVHDLIVALPEGYDTRVGDRGSVLAAGQRQRVALARALYGEPFLVVLDEPNSNLDTEGETALRRAIEVTRERGAVVVVVSHRPSVLEAATHILALNGGQQQSFGPKQDPGARAARRDPPNFGSFKILPQQQGA